MQADETDDIDSPDDDDGRELLLTLDGDRDEARRLADLFFTTGADQIAAIQHAVRQQDRKTILFNAHKCAGGASACGFNALADRLATLEHEGEQMTWEALAPYCARLSDLFERTRMNVERFFAAGGDPA